MADTESNRTTLITEYRGIPGVPNYRAEVYAEKQSDYCLLILCLNEGERLHAELGRALKAGVHELVDMVLLDGASTDGSTREETLRQFQVNSLLTIEEEGRQAASLRTGFHWALERGYQGILTIDGNNKDSIEDVPRFLEKLAEGYGFVQGSRYCMGGAKSVPLGFAKRGRRCYMRPLFRSLRIVGLPTQ